MPREGSDGRPTARVVGLGAARALRPQPCALWSLLPRGATESPRGEARGGCRVASPAPGPITSPRLITGLLLRETALPALIGRGLLHGAAFSMGAIGGVLKKVVVGGV